MIGGSISFSYKESKPSSDSESTTTSLGVQPGYGLFVIDNLCVGASAGFNLGKSVLPPGVVGLGITVNSRSFSPGPFVRYYVPITSKLYALGHASYNWQWYRTKTTYVSPTGTGPHDPLLAPIIDKRKMNSWTLGAGISYFLNPNIALEAILSYSHDVDKDNDSPDNSNRSLFTRKTDGLGLSVGLQIFLRKSE